MTPDQSDTGADTGTESPGPLEIFHSTHMQPANGNGDFDRTRVGVGEQVNFWTLEEGGTWTASAGTIEETEDGPTWTAPAVGGTATITHTLDGQRSTVEMTVVAPMWITASGQGAGPAVPAASAGVVITIPLVMNPLDVCFGNVEWLEDPGPAIPWGFFSDKGDTYYHTPNAQWTPMGDDHRNITDTAGFSWTPGPADDPMYAPGGFMWLIPNRYRIIGEGGAGHVFWLQPQVMRITDDAGTASVWKFGQSASAPAQS